MLNRFDGKPNRTTFSNVLFGIIGFYITISKYKDYSVIDLREYEPKEIPKTVREASIFYQIDRFYSSIQQYRNEFDQSNMLTRELEKVKVELKEMLFRYITEKRNIWNVIHYFENRMSLSYGKGRDEKV